MKRKTNILFSLLSVSYTHLDVYKRQENHLRNKGCTWNTVSTYMRTLRSIYNKGVDDGLAEEKPRLFRQDVYKRQTIGSTPVLNNIPICSITTITPVSYTHLTYRGTSVISPGCFQRRRNSVLLLYCAV